MILLNLNMFPLEELECYCGFFRRHYWIEALQPALSLLNPYLEGGVSIMSLKQAVIYNVSLVKSEEHKTPTVFVLYLWRKT